ncbi:hypothetical protein HYR69_02635 [Candidatus Sumerlaeota bacterium]|nr:hypothetical protein [Candidatus Sumerlaeota bacterium]
MVLIERYAHAEFRPLTTGSFTIPILAAPAAEFVPETRVYYMERVKGYTRENLREEITRAERAGFNVILFPVYVNGYTLFPSAEAKAAGFLAINPQYRRWDPVAEATSIAHGLGINVWGMARPYNFHPRYSTVPHRLLNRFPQWRIEVHPYYKRARLKAREAIVACPVNRGYRRYLGDILTELVVAYPIDGLVINYTGYGLRGGPVQRYPYCFCKACRTTYAEESGEDLVNNALHVEGLDRIRKWQTEMSTAAVEYLRHRIIKSRRTLRLICRVQPQWRDSPEETSSEMQFPYCLDWNAMLETGSVEELLVDHDDETAPDLFRMRLVTDLAALHDEAFILPAVRVSQPQDLEQPIEAIRRYPVAGFLAEFVGQLSERDAEFIRENYLSQPAQSPDHSPLMAVNFFLKRIQANHRDNDLISDFMRDFLRLVETQVVKGLSFNSLQVILENLAGLQGAIRRGRLGDYHIPESTMRDIGLARKIVRLACLDVRS